MPFTPTRRWLLKQRLEESGSDRGRIGREVESPGAPLPGAFVDRPVASVAHEQRRMLENGGMGEILLSIRAFAGADLSSAGPTGD